MYLLNLVWALTMIIASLLFTFHYVSIKSMVTGSTRYRRYAFTFHYVSIKSIIRIRIYRAHLYLHSTMYLLNPDALF